MLMSDQTAMSRAAAPAAEGPAGWERGRHELRSVLITAAAELVRAASALDVAPPPADGAAHRRAENALEAARAVTATLVTTSEN